MMILSEAANVVQGEFEGTDRLFTAVTTDSRTTDNGHLFVAIPGEQNNGHDFVSHAECKGAVGAMVSESVDTGLAQIKVPDTTRAMGQLAHYWRSQFDIPLLGITGSNGKTTITAMVASILNQCGKCLSPEKSFNNQWGVPLTLLKLNSEHDFAVIEMGTNHAGEIAYLCQLSKPNFALISNISSAHLKGLESLDKIAQAKAEIFSEMSGNDSAIINVDDAFGEKLMQQFKSQLKRGRIVTFGIENPADVTASNIKLDWSGSQFYLNIGDQAIEIGLSLPGTHNIMNALAAAGICFAVGASPAAIRAGLENSQPVPGRLNIKNGLHGSTVIDDSYNANPQSIKAGIDMLSKFDGAKIVVLGAMAELGASSKRQHIEVGEYIKQKGVSELYCLVEEENMDAQYYTTGFGDHSKTYNGIDHLVFDLKAILGNRMAVLVKGSRSARMERVVFEIAADAQPNKNCNHEMTDLADPKERASTC